MQNDVVLTMRGICKSFPGTRALHNVDFTLRKGEIHALMGENGAGKSTLIKVLTGVYEKDSGSITVDGKDTAAASRWTEKTRISVPRRTHRMPESVQCTRKLRCART